MNNLWIALGRAVLDARFFDDIDDLAEYAFSPDPSGPDARPKLPGMKQMQELLLNNGLSVTRDEVWAIHRICSATRKRPQDRPIGEILADLRGHAGMLERYATDYPTTATIGLACIDELFASGLVEAGKAGVAALATFLRGGSINGVLHPKLDVPPAFLPDLATFVGTQSSRPPYGDVVEDLLHELSKARWWMNRTSCKQGYTLDSIEFFHVLDNDEFGLGADEERDSLWGQVVELRSHVEPHDEA